MWFLDETELSMEYARWAERKGLPLEPLMAEENERYNLPILSEKNVDVFIPRIAKYAVTADELREYLKVALELESREDVFYDYLPSLYIDFDKRILYSLYTEPASFEDYVPQYWEGHYKDFLNMINLHERYWCENGDTIFEFRKGDTWK
jgi:hypothetical protein